MIFEEKTLESERMYTGSIFNIRKDKVTVMNGSSYRDILEHNGGSVIVPIKDNGNVVMVRQYRKAADAVMLEAPAGKIDEGENPLDAAKRELKEETGYTASDVTLLTEMMPTPGYSEEVLYLYVATGLVPGETDFDENEAIDIVEYHIDELFDMVMSGKIRDGKTQVAVLMVKNLYDNGALKAGE